MNNFEDGSENPENLSHEELSEQYAQKLGCQSDEVYKGLKNLTLTEAVNQLYPELAPGSPARAAASRALTGWIDAEKRSDE